MADKQDSRSQLLNGNVFKTMLSLSVPAILGMVVIGLYNFMDAVFVGRMVGPEAMTAVKVSYPFTLLNSGIATLIGTGSASVLSRAVGRKDQGTVNQIMGNLIALIVLLSLIITAVGEIFTTGLLSLSGAKGEILAQAEKYLKVVFIGSLFVNFAQSANMVMRGEGKLKIAMGIMAAGALLNIALDPLLISLIGKENGVLGAAWATVISQVLQACFTLWYFRKKSENVKIHKIKIHGNLVGPVLGVGVSAMLMQVMTMVQQTIMYNTVERWGGGSWQTVLGACLSLQSFAFIPLWGISQGFQPAIFSGDTARKVREARKLLGENLSTDYSVETLSARVKLNRTTLQQVFRQVYGMTIYEYRTQVRMQEVRNLLLRDDLTVTEVAGRCGYTNASKFAAVFRKVTGMNPGEWKRNSFHLGQMCSE